MAGNSLSTPKSSSSPSLFSSSSFSPFSNPTSNFGSPFSKHPFQPRNSPFSEPCTQSSTPFHVSSSSTPLSTVSCSLFSTITTTTPADSVETSPMQFPAFGVPYSIPGISASTAAAATLSNANSAAQILSSQVVASNSGVTTDVGKVDGLEPELPSETTGKTFEEVILPPFPQEVGFVGLRTEAYRIPLLPAPPELVDFLNSHQKDEFGILQDMYKTFSSWEGLLSFILSRSSDTRTLLSTYDRMAEASGVQLTSSNGTGTGPWAVARSRVSSGTRPSNS